MSCSGLPERLFKNIRRPAEIPARKFPRAFPENFCGPKVLSGGLDGKAAFCLNISQGSLPRTPFVPHS
jgi:hypothetical protein